MSRDDPHGPFVLCYDGSEPAECAIRVMPALLGRGRAARVLYASKPTEMGLGIAHALTGGRVDAPVSADADAYDLVDAGVATAGQAGFDAEVLWSRPAGRPPSVIASAAEELHAPGIVIGQPGLSGLKSAVRGRVSREVINAYHRPVVVA